MSLAPLLLLAGLAAAGNAPDFDPAMPGVGAFQASPRPAAPAAPLTTSKAAIEAIVAAHVASGRFDRLPKVPVVVEDDLVSDFDFLRTDVNGATRDWDRRTYVVKVNKKLYDDSPGEDALRAILSHELKHLHDYTHSSTLDMALLGLPYVFSETAPAIVAYERKTDEFTLGLGLGEGLKAYRRYLYAHLTPERADMKRRIYYTPEQIDAWVLAHPPAR